MQSSIKSVVAALLVMTISVVSSAQSNRFSISLNSLTTNFNYGNSNSALKPFKNNFKGFQAGFSYQAGITPMFSVVPELYFAIKGG
ncbi:MAG: PorT family protein, partial [Flavitalea sp.]